MNPISLIFLALAISTDAFAAAIGKGASLHKPYFIEALRTGLIFGVIEAITPVVGWGIGQVATKYVESWDHWIAFTLLLVLGLHMIYNGFKHEDAEEEKPNLNTKLPVHLPGMPPARFVLGRRLRQGARRLGSDRPERLIYQDDTGGDDGAGVIMDTTYCAD